MSVLFKAGHSKDVYVFVDGSYSIKVVPHSEDDKDKLEQYIKEEIL